MALNIQTLKQKRSDLVEKEIPHLKTCVNECNVTLDLLRNESISEYEQDTKNKFKAFLDLAAQQMVQTTQEQWDAAMNTVEQYKLNEAKKSRYQTIRFFDTKELINYEAELSKETDKIPNRVNERVRSGTFATF